MRLLIVEDEQKLANAIKQGLEQERYAVDVAYDGEEGLNAAREDSYDLIILDVMLPGKNGFEICEELRRDAIHTPVLLLTARDQNRDIVEGLNAGADDYLIKPFSFDVLLARIRALLRRPRVATGTILQAGDLTLDTNTKSVLRGGKTIRLSSTEYALLEYLLRNKGRVLSKDVIMSHVWDFDADILPNTVEVFITYLRSKIDRPFAKSQPLIKTMRGFGYVLEDSET